MSTKASLYLLCFKIQSFKLFFILLSLGIPVGLPVWMYTIPYVSGCLCNLEEGTRSPWWSSWWLWATWSGCWEWRPGPPAEQKVFLNAESSSQTQTNFERKLPKKVEIPDGEFQENKSSTSEEIKYSFITSYCLFMWGEGCPHATEHTWRSEDNQWELVSSYHVDSQNQNQVVANTFTLWVTLLAVKYSF